MVPDSRRSHHRLQVRGQAAMRHSGTLSGVYIVDVSPKGVGLYSPMQLLPKTQVVLICDQWEELPLTIRRCQRLRDTCYLCGTCFLEGPMSSADYRDFLRQLESGSPN